MLSSIRVPLAVAALACLALAPAASAAPGSGSASLTVGGKGKAAKALSAAGVRVAAVKPARKSGKRVVLPVKSIAVGKSATATLRGGIRFKAGKRALKLGSVRVKLTARRATVTAKPGGKRRTAVFAATLPKGKAKFDATKATAKLARAKLVLTRKGAKLLRAKLRVSGIPAGQLGRLRVDAQPRGAVGDAPGAPGSPGSPGSGPGGGPQAGPIKSAPPVLARPASAVDVTSASLTWRPRASWIEYINGGEGTSVSGGAVNGPPEAGGLVYSFGFPFKNGWYDAATGMAGIYFQGGVGFRWSAHGINFSTSNPEVEINGGASRAIFTINGTQNTKYDNERGVLVDLHPAAIQTPPGGEVVYADIPATIPADTGASVFAGFYTANAEFGTLSVTFTTP